MSSSKRLQPVARIVREWEQDAARIYADCQNEVRAKQRQLDELLAYRDEYARRLERSGEHGLSALQARDYSIFLARLNEAIQQQYKALELARSVLEQRHQSWQEKHRQADAIDKVLGRQEKREQSSLRRQEQRESDEHAQHVLRRMSS